MLNELPEVSKKKFAHCFGNMYVVPNRAQEGFDVSSVGLFAIDRDSYPLTVLQLQNRELSRDAEREKQRIFDASLATPNFDTHAEVKKVMLHLASLAQYEQVFEFLHVSELEHDLRCISQNSVLRFLEIPQELVERTRAECDRLQREIDSVRLNLELPLFKKMYGELAPDIREKLKWMYDGVWCDLESG